MRAPVLAVAVVMASVVATAPSATSYAAELEMGTPNSSAVAQNHTQKPTLAPNRVLEPGERLHIQFTGRFHLPKQTEAVELDGAGASASQVRQLKRQGYSTICYVSAGSWEDYRNDAHQFPPQLLGRRLDGWPNERWLDVRERGALLPLMERRVKQCARKGFQGIEFDNVDGYSNLTGFPITRRHQLRFNKGLARVAKKHGLSPGLKNSIGLVRPLSRKFDWALNEECVTYDECGVYRHFTKRGKAVVIIEYGETSRRSVCREASRIGATAQLKRLSLSAWARRC
jgi:hypothetical protein